MKSIIIKILLLSFTPLSLAAQLSDCYYFIRTVDQPIRKKVRQSLYPLHFNVTENIDVTLQLSNKGSAKRLELMLDFDDKSGLPMELGSTLIIKFSDGTTQSILSRTKKVFSSVVYFTIAEPRSNLLQPSPVSMDDILLTDKLSRVELDALEITIDGKPREIHIPETKAAIIKKTISCLTSL